MIIREANRNDLEGILKLYRQLNPEDDKLSIDSASNIWEQINATPNFKYFIALENEQIISSCNISIIPNLTRNGRSHAIVENVITDKEFRKRGIGKKVMQMAIDYAQFSKCYKVVLLSSIKRKEAHLFYEKLGFDGNSKKGFEIRFA
jgi:GNAT superfamily N-acetyltransferase